MFKTDLWLSLIFAGLAWAAIWSLGRLAMQAITLGRRKSK